MHEGMSFIIINADSIKLPPDMETLPELVAYLTPRIEGDHMPMDLEFMIGSEVATKAIQQDDYELEGPELEVLAKMPGFELHGIELLEHYQNNAPFEHFFMGQVVKTLTGPNYAGEVEIRRRLGAPDFRVIVRLGLATMPMFAFQYVLSEDEANKVFKVKDHV